MARWLALLAPLGIPSARRSILERDGRWEFYSPAPLVDADGREVGSVLRVTATDGVLMGSGSVTDPAAAEAMRAKRLWPELVFDQFSREQVDEGAGALEATVRYRAGRISAVVLATSPPWPHVWLEVERIEPR